jgi:hypothetical protein
VVKFVVNWTILRSEPHNEISIYIQYFSKFCVYRQDYELINSEQNGKRFCSSSFNALQDGINFIWVRILFEVRILSEDIIEGLVYGDIWFIHG